jgi:molybdopterin molybdotransferase
VNIPHFALPGSPPATMITFEVLVRPAILKMIGKTDLSAPAIEAVMEEPIKNSKAVRRFVWVTIESRNGCYYASQTSLHVKGILSSIVPATGLAIVPETNPHVERGDRLQVILLDWH